jgi:hypothetical protein
LPKEALEEIVVDQKTAITLKPDARPKWLSKACKLTQEGKASATDLYNIVVSRRFSAGLPERIGRKLGVVVKKNLNLFSEKQRRHLSSSEFHLNVHMGEATTGDIDGEDGDIDGENPANASERTEAMMANCRAFVREQADSFESKQREADLAREVQEADRQSRIVEEAAKRNRKEAEQREARKRFVAEEAEAVSRKAATKEADRKRKLEEEADALFERALVPAARRDQDSDRGRGRDRGRSRSVSAARISLSPPRRKGRPEWRGAHPGELTGSRAILLNRDFQDDLPHLPRPGQGGQRVTHSFAPDNDKRSRSRDRSRRRRR